LSQSAEATLSITAIFMECHYAEFHILFIVMLIVNMLSVVMLIVNMLSVVMLNVISLRVVAPFTAFYHLLKNKIVIIGNMQGPIL
jgi:hypothetical protein